MSFDNNRLIDRYTHIKNKTLFANNQLLQNNPISNRNIQQIKDLQKVKQLEKLNEFEYSVNQNKIKELIINPIKIERSIKEKQDFEKKIIEIEKNYRDSSGKDIGPEIKKYWKDRSNEPYKNIMKNEDYTKKFVSVNDLIVHRVTNRDKVGVEEGFKELQTNIEKHDNELKIIYSTNNKIDHKKKFEYKHVYKYRIKYDPKDHNKLKQDKMQYYKEQQKKEEDGKIKLDSILETLLNDGIFNKNELSNIDISHKI